MSERNLRGSRLGAASLESESGVELAERQQISYHCPNGHTTVVPMSLEADVPALWECRCGAEALRTDTEAPEKKNGKPARTHWDMLLERRTIAELEVLLDERLELLRSRELIKRSA
ncbi:RNA polymerase-binding protein RbpA [Paenibacillus sp. TRM 82003]|uniref:RNA polymerase-binding protein RbpA n=1 Tax=unclassified Kineococcus TaxID=2621656 RepID=UPI001F5903EF|nr:RNA polymerase-binding protein RbpA [Kineococcus sp. TRM81007]MCI2237731.1 RNA polymerase-binding protein RbpA [Kineococcus sp. TRM81007]MCI3921749.1 RNA polymerase-binding protein RbpA [Paenibacillus sp. TRM 82003]